MKPPRRPIPFELWLVPPFLMLAGGILLGAQVPHPHWIGVAVGVALVITSLSSFIHLALLRR